VALFLFVVRSAKGNNLGPTPRATGQRGRPEEGRGKACFVGHPIGPTRRMLSRFPMQFQRTSERFQMPPFDLLALGCGMNEVFGVGPDGDVAIWGQAIGIG